MPKQAQMLRRVRLVLCSGSPSSIHTVTWAESLSLQELHLEIQPRTHTVRIPEAIRYL